MIPAMVDMIKSTPRYDRASVSCFGTFVLAWRAEGGGGLPYFLV